jgi:hypothetical protein
MISTILVAIDEPQHAREIVAFASELGKSLDASFVVMHAREWILGPGGPSTRVQGFRSLEFIVSSNNSPQKACGFAAPSRAATSVMQVNSSWTLLPRRARIWSSLDPTASMISAESQPAACLSTS